MRNVTLVRAMVVGVVILMAAPVGSKGDLSSASQKQPLKAKPTPQKPSLPARPLEVGRASWYGEKFHGHPTATGEQFDMFQLTAAHRTLPLGSLVRVTHLRTRKSVVVRINDRGPVLPHMMIDLSYAAARELGILHQGIAHVRLDLVKASRTPRLETVSAVTSE